MANPRTPLRINGPGPFRVRVYDKAFAYQFTLDRGDIILIPRHNVLGAATIVLPLSDPRALYMFTPGTRIVADYFLGGDRSDDADYLLNVISGYVTAQSIPQDAVPRVGKLVTFTITDDNWVISWMCGWPNPASGIGAQTASAVDAQTGKAETVIKHYVSANASRLSIPVTVATDLARGATVSASVRFDNLWDVLPPLATTGGLGIRTTQVGTGLVVDVYVPTDRTALVMSEDNAIISSWQLNAGVMAATREIVGGPGSGTARPFREVIDATGLEAAYGMKLEQFVDASDTTDTGVQDQRGAAALVAASPVTGYSVTINESRLVRFGDDLFLGDMVAVGILPGIVHTDVLGQVTLSDTAAGGFTITPQVGSGDPTAGPDARFAKQIAALRTWVRFFRSSR